MAGIGFRLQKLLNEDSFRSTAQAYIYSAVVSTGPWLLAITSLMAISLLARLFIQLEQIAVFQCIIAYTYAGSLILTGIVQLATTRYIADRLYVDDANALRPCYQWVSIVTLITSGIIAAAFHTFAGLNLPAATAAVVLFQAVCITWTGMIFLSAAKDYESIVRAFALGYGFSLAAALAGALHYHLAGLLWGFASGQILLAVLLSIRIRLEFKSDRAIDANVIRYWRIMPGLIVIGLFYNAAIWIDKIIFWLSPRGVQLLGWFRFDPAYDTSIYLAYLTIVPAMTLFLLRVETDFYRHYALYYEAVTQRGSLDTIIRHRRDMMDVLRSSTIGLIKAQGGTTCVLYLLAPLVLDWLHLSPATLPVFRLCLLAAFIQVLLLLLLIILLYFDWQLEVAWLTTTFFLLNGGLTLLSLYIPPKFQGTGYLAATLITLIIAIITLERRMAVLEQDTFTRQPFIT